MKRVVAAGPATSPAAVLPQTCSAMVVTTREAMVADIAMRLTLLLPASLTQRPVETAPVPALLAQPLGDENLRLEAELPADDDVAGDTGKDGPCPRRGAGRCSWC